MSALSARSAERLASCDPRLIRLFETVAAHWNVLILEGHRSQSAQDQAFALGRSKLKWPHSKHNTTPSQAVDAAPAPLDWQDRERFSLFAGFVLGTAAAQGIAVRWGGDWNRNNQVGDNRFDDLVHFELVAG
jgi:peptidoglycan LD-endopeptidase CwlK